ncbi:MAG TPA: cytochrome b/b6 domain-containing protein [Candidatus Limnocylindria bacterium]|nr:cytochrome b/b6 domain-containing protein [Candidatus Limnocylindria bacterium]
MRAKTLALFTDIVLVALVIGGAAWLFLAGIPAGAWTTDKTMLPLSVDGSRALLLLTAAGVVAGMFLTLVARRVPDRIVGRDAIRYSGYQRLVHWAFAIGFILDFVTAAWILRWLWLETSPAILPALYLVHFIGASLIMFAAAMFVTTSRVRGEQDLFPRRRDVGPALARLFGYLGVYGEPGVLGMRWPEGWQKGTQAWLAGIGIRPAEREGKFLAAEKVLSFTPLAILSLVVIGTGLIKAARYFFVIPENVTSWATWLHGLSTWGVLFVVGAHVAAILLVRRNRPGIRAMVTGRMDLHHVEEEFPAWADELRRGEPRSPAREAVHAPSTPGD